jgi:serine/threonine-protein kinase RsbW
VIEALVVDSGDPFDKTAVATPNLEEPQEHGYGLFLIEQLVDDFKYTRLPAGNQWQLKRILS